MSQKNLGEEYTKLASYTINKADAYFIHQHVVDAYGAQIADENTKPIGITFALVGLYLFLEKGFSGKQVQRVHMIMAKNKRKWPKFNLPKDRGSITISDVLKVPDNKKDLMIKKWCKSIWDAYKENHQIVKEIIEEYLD